MKKFLIVVFVVGIIGITVVAYLWNKPHRKVEDIKGVLITAIQLSNQYNANERAADSLYLNKAIEVSGRINTIEKNQEGGQMIILDGGDPSYAVQCAIRDKVGNFNVGQSITLKGFCSGSSITGVSLTDCIAK